MKTKLILTMMVGLTSYNALANSFEHSFNLLSDHSVATNARQDENNAHRLLFTTEWQWQADERWQIAGNLKAFRGDNGEGLTDNIQGISNIDAEKFSKIYEVFVLYQFNDQTRAKCGQVDANLEFAFVPVAGTFISPPLGITPTAIALPTYYDPALSCSVFYEPEQGFQWMGGVFAGRDHLNFAEQFYVVEGRYVTSSTRWSYGYWHHNGDWALLNEDNTKAISGWYLNYQLQLNQDWALFAVWSSLNDEVDITRQHHMLGVVRQYEAHQLGMMFSEVTQPHSAKEYLAEMYWQYQLLPELLLQPVLQWVNHAEPGIENQFVWTFRLNWSF
jgi:porin